MFDSFETGVLYTEHAGLPATMPGLTSLWSYETRTRGQDRVSVMRNPDGSHEYWLARSDPLLNTILPGMGVSLVVNLAERPAGDAQFRIQPLEIGVYRVVRNAQVMGDALVFLIVEDSLYNLQFAWREW